MVKIIAWGSLYWDSRELQMSSQWDPGGPSLPIEFSRVSADGRLTLVVDPRAGAPVKTWTCDSPLALHDAVANLSIRERCPTEDIGWVDLRSGDSSPHHKATVQGVRDWCVATDVTAAVWTALPPTFLQVARVPFSVENALTYLDRLDGGVRQRAFEYIRRAPGTTMTAVRRSFDARWPQSR